MVYYVVYKASKDLTNRSLIPTRLRDLGCRQLNKTFWEFDKEKTGRVLKLLDKNKPILLRRIKEVKKRSIVKGKIVDLGSLTIVSFTAPPEKRETIRNFTRKTPCIKLCRRVYAFYHLQKKVDPQRKLVDVQGLATFVNGLEGTIKIIPKVTVVDSRSTERLVDDTKQQMEKEIHDIILTSRQVDLLHCNRELDLEKLRVRLRKLRALYVKINRKARFYSRWMALDFSKYLMRAYKALLKLKHHCKNIDVLLTLS